MPQRFALHGIVGAGVKLAMHNMLSDGSRSRGKPDLLFMAAADDKMPILTLPRSPTLYRQAR
jgi:hypothetical protein